MTSQEMRKNPIFIRGGFPCAGELEIPVIRKETLPDETIDLIACSRTRLKDSEERRRKGVHFFLSMIIGSTYCVEIQMRGWRNSASMHSFLRQTSRATTRCRFGR